MNSRAVNAIPLLLVIVALATLATSCSAPMNVFESEQAADPEFPRTEPDYGAKLVRDFTNFEEALHNFEPSRAAELDEQLVASTIFDIQAMMDEGLLDSVELVTYYVSRIQKYDVDMLNSVMELNPEALQIAAQLDSERDRGAVRGPMHGIPVLLKANIATEDQMKTTAGAVAMTKWRPKEDAALVTQLRKAGAVILGKTNLSEWANYMDQSLPNGFSALGGQTRAAYGPYDPLGSSTGSAVSAAANFATVTVGTETQGSIVLPAKVNGVVGLKPSRGLVSGTGIIPLVDWMDTPGAMGRNVTDVAVLLMAMIGPEDNGQVSNDIAEVLDIDFAQYLSTDAAQGVRVGVVGAPAELFDDAIRSAEEDGGHELSEDEVAQVRRFIDGLLGDPEAISEVLNSQGIESVTIDLLAVQNSLTVTDPTEALEYGFQDSFNTFMEELGDDAPYASLAEVAAFNEEDLANRAPYGQGYVAGSANTTITAAEYAALKDENLRSSADALRAVFERYDVDVIACRNCTQEYAPAGFPAITIPDGYDGSGMPISLILVGDYLSEPQLLSVAYAYELGTPDRVEPDLGLRMQQIAPVVSVAGEGE